MKELFVIKIGGSIIDETPALDDFLTVFAAIKAPKILIHGGGKIATQIGEKLGIEQKMVDGRRITDEATLDLVTMVYGGLLNKQIVSLLQAKGCNSIGLTGADGNLLKALKRPINEINYGFVGDVDKSNVNTELIESLIDQGLSLVMPALTHDGHGHMLNTNADTMASIIAQAMSLKFGTKLIYCFEQPGVLMDMKNKKVFDRLNLKNTDQYINNGVIHSGMLPKLKNAFEAKSNGVESVRIGAFNDLNELIKDKQGTEIL